MLIMTMLNCPPIQTKESPASSKMEDSGAKGFTQNIDGGQQGIQAETIVQNFYNNPQGIFVLCTLPDNFVFIECACLSLSLSWTLLRSGCLFFVACDHSSVTAFFFLILLPGTTAHPRLEVVENLVTKIMGELKGIPKLERNEVLTRLSNLYRPQGYEILLQKHQTSTTSPQYFFIEK